MAVVALIQPAAYEACAGIVTGVVPAGTDRISIRVDGRSVGSWRLANGRRRFSVGPLALPARDVTLRVLAMRDATPLGGATVRPVFGLPSASLRLTAPRVTDAAAQAALRRLRGPGVTAVWLRNLATGRAASWNAGARFSAASTLKLAILMTALARSSGDPVHARSWGTMRRMVIDSDNASANALEASFGGSTSGGSALVNAFCAALGCRDTDMYGGYEIGAALARAHAPEVPPVTRDATPATTGPGKHTTAHDLGVLLSTLVAAADGRGRGLRLGITAREARVALWLLLHARYPGLVRPSVPWPTAHKAGWLGDVEHDAAIVFTPAGPLVAVIMSQGRVTVGSSQRYGASVLRIARDRLG